MKILTLLVKVLSAYKFWNAMVLGSLILCITSIEIRSIFKADLSPDVRSLLKEIHETTGLLMVYSACFHGFGHSKYMGKLRAFVQKKPVPVKTESVSQ